MGVAIGLAFVAGLITAVSPCVLPVLPILLAGGASGGRRRPYAIIAGLVVTFLVSILFATWILDQLGLPDDLLAQHLHRAALRDRGDADLPAVRRSHRAAALAPLAATFERSRWRLPARVRARLRVRPLRRAGDRVRDELGREPRLRLQDLRRRDRIHARGGRRPPRHRARRTACVAPHPRGRRAVQGRLRHPDRGSRVRARLQSRHEAADLAAGVHGRAPAADRGEHVGPGRVLARPEPDRAEGLDAPRQAAFPTTAPHPSSTASRTGSTRSR